MKPSDHGAAGGRQGRSAPRSAAASFAVAAGLAVLVLACFDPIGFTAPVPSKKDPAAFNPDTQGHVVVWNMTGTEDGAAGRSIGKEVSVAIAPASGGDAVSVTNVKGETVLQPASKSVSARLEHGLYTAVFTPGADVAAAAGDAGAATGGTDNTIKLDLYVSPESDVHGIQYIYFYSLTPTGVYDAAVSLEAVLYQAQLLNVVASSTSLINGEVSADANAIIAAITELAKAEGASLADVATALATYLTDVAIEAGKLSSEDENKAVAALRDAIAKQLETMGVYLEDANVLAGELQDMLASGLGAISAAASEDTDRLVDGIVTAINNHAEAIVTGLDASLVTLGDKLGEHLDAVVAALEHSIDASTAETVLIVRNLTIPKSHPASVTKVSIEEFDVLDKDVFPVSGSALTEIGPNAEWGVVLSQAKIVESGTYTIALEYAPQAGVKVAGDQEPSPLRLVKTLQKGKVNVVYFYYSASGYFAVSGRDGGPADPESGASWYSGGIKVHNDTADGTIITGLSWKRSSEEWPESVDIEDVAVGLGNHYAIGNLQTGDYYDIRVWIDNETPDETNDNAAYLFRKIQARDNMGGEARLASATDTSSLARVVIRNLMPEDALVIVSNQNAAAANGSAVASVKSGGEAQVAVAPGNVRADARNAAGAARASWPAAAGEYKTLNAGAKTYVYLYQTGAAEWEMAETLGDVYTPPGKGVVIAHNMTDRLMTVSCAAQGVVATAAANADTVLTLLTGAAEITANGSGRTASAEVNVTAAEPAHLYYYRSTDGTYKLATDMSDAEVLASKGVVVVHNMTEWSMAVYAGGVMATAGARQDATLVLNAGSVNLTVTGIGGTWPVSPETFSVAVNADTPTALYYYRTADGTYALDYTMTDPYTEAGQGVVVVHNMTDAGMTVSAGRTVATAGARADAVLVLDVGDVEVTASGSGGSATWPTEVVHAQPVYLYYYQYKDKSYKLDLAVTDPYTPAGKGVIVVHNMTGAGMAAYAGGQSATAAAKADAVLVVDISPPDVEVRASGSGGSATTAPDNVTVVTDEPVNLYYYKSTDPLKPYKLSVSLDNLDVSSGMGVVVVRNLTDAAMTASSGSVAATAAARADAVLALPEGAAVVAASGHGAIGPITKQVTVEHAEPKYLYYYKAASGAYALTDEPDWDDLLVTTGKAVIVVHNMTDAGMAVSARGATATAAAKAAALLTVDATTSDVVVKASGSGGSPTHTLTGGITGDEPTHLYYYYGYVDETDPARGGEYKLDIAMGIPYAAGRGVVVVRNYTDASMTAAAGGVTATAAARTDAVLVVTTGAVNVVATGAGGTLQKQGTVTAETPLILYYYRNAAGAYVLTDSPPSGEDLYAPLAQGVIVVHNMTDAGMAVEARSGIGSGTMSAIAAAKADAVLTVGVGVGVTVTAKGASPAPVTALVDVDHDAPVYLYYYRDSTGAYQLADTLGELYTAAGRGVIVVHNMTDAGMTVSAGVATATAAAKADAVLTLEAGLSVSVTASGSGAPDVTYPETGTLTVPEDSPFVLYYYRYKDGKNRLDVTMDEPYATAGQGVVVVHNMTNAGMVASSGGVLAKAAAKAEALLTLPVGSNVPVTASGSGSQAVKPVTVETGNPVYLYYYVDIDGKYCLDTAMTNADALEGHGWVIVHNLTDAPMVAFSGGVTAKAAAQDVALLMLPVGDSVTVWASGSGFTTFTRDPVVVWNEPPTELYYYRIGETDYEISASPDNIYAGKSKGVVMVFNLTDGPMSVVCGAVTASVEAGEMAMLTLDVDTSSTTHEVTAVGVYGTASNRVKIETATPKSLFYYRSKTAYPEGAAKLEVYANPSDVYSPPGKGVVVVTNLTDASMIVVSGAETAAAAQNQSVTLTLEAGEATVFASGSGGRASATVTITEDEPARLYYYRYGTSNNNGFKLVENYPDDFYVEDKFVVVVQNLTGEVMTVTTLANSAYETATVEAKGFAYFTMAPPTTSLQVRAYSAMNPGGTLWSGNVGSDFSVTEPLQLYYYESTGTTSGYDLNIEVVNLKPATNTGVLVVHNLTDSGMTVTAGGVMATAAPRCDAVLLLELVQEHDVYASGSGAKITAEAVTVSATEQTDLYFYYKSVAGDSGQPGYVLERTVESPSPTSTGKGVVVVHNLTDAVLTASANGVVSTAGPRADAVLVLPSGLTPKVTASGSGKTAAYTLASPLPENEQIDLYYFQTSASPVTYKLDPDYSTMLPRDGKGTLVVHNLTDNGMTATASGIAGVADGATATAGPRSDAVMTLPEGVAGKVYASGSGGHDTIEGVTVTAGEQTDLYYYLGSDGEYTLDDEAPGADSIYTAPGKGAVVVHNLTARAMTVSVGAVTATAGAGSDAVLLLDPVVNATLTASGLKKAEYKSLVVESGETKYLYYYQDGAASCKVVDELPADLYTPPGKGAVVVHNMTDRGVTVSVGAVTASAMAGADAVLMLDPGDDIQVTAIGADPVPQTCGVKAESGKTSYLYYYRTPDGYELAENLGELYMPDGSGVIIVHNLTTAAMTATAGLVSATAGAGTDAVLVLTAKPAGYTVIATGSSMTRQLAGVAVTDGAQTELYFYPISSSDYKLDYTVSETDFYTPAGKGVILAHNLTGAAMTVTSGVATDTAAAHTDAVLVVTSGNAVTVTVTGSTWTETQLRDVPSRGTLVLWFYQTGPGAYAVSETEPASVYTPPGKGVVIVHNLTDAGMTATVAGQAATYATAGAKGDAILTLDPGEYDIKATGSGKFGLVEKIPVASGGQVDLYYFQKTATEYELAYDPVDMYAPAGKGVLIVHNLTDAPMTATASGVTDTAAAKTDAVLSVKSGNVSVTVSGSGQTLKKTVAVPADDLKELYFYQKDATTYALVEDTPPTDGYNPPGKGTVVVHNLTDNGMTAKAMPGGVIATAGPRADATLVVTAGSVTVSVTGSGASLTWSAMTVGEGEQKDLYFYRKSGTYVLEDSYTEIPEMPTGKGVVVVHNLTDAVMTASAAGVAASAGARGDAALMLTVGSYTVYASGSGQTKNLESILVEEGVQTDLYFFRQSPEMPVTYTLAASTDGMYTPPGSGRVVIHNLTDAGVTAEAGGVIASASARADTVLTLTAGTYTVTATGSGKSVPKTGVVVADGGLIHLYFYPVSKTEYKLEETADDIYTPAGSGVVIVHNLTSAVMTATAGGVKDTAGPKTDAVLVLPQGTYTVTVSGSGATPPPTMPNVVVVAGEQQDLYFFPDSATTYKLDWDPTGKIYTGSGQGVILVHNLTGAAMTATAGVVTDTAGAGTDAVLVVTAGSVSLTVTGSGQTITTSWTVPDGGQLPLWFYQKSAAEWDVVDQLPTVWAGDQLGVIAVHNMTDAGMTVTAGGVTASAGARSDAILVLPVKADGYSVTASGSGARPTATSGAVVNGDTTDMYFFQDTATTYTLATTFTGMYTPDGQGVVVVHNRTSASMTVSCGGVTASAGVNADAALTLPAGSRVITASGSGPATFTETVVAGETTYLYYYRNGENSYTLARDMTGAYAGAGKGLVIVRNLTDVSMTVVSGTERASAGPNTDAVLSLTEGTRTVTASGAGPSPVSLEVTVSAAAPVYLYYFKDTAGVYQLKDTAAGAATPASKGLVIVHNMTDAGMTVVTDAASGSVSGTAAARADAVLTANAGVITLTASGAGYTARYPDTGTATLDSSAPMILYYYRAVGGSYKLDVAMTDPYAPAGSGVIIVHNMTDGAMTATASASGVSARASAKTDAALVVPAGSITVMVNGLGGPISATVTLAEQTTARLYYYRDGQSSYKLETALGSLYQDPGKGVIVVHNMTDSGMSASADGVTATAPAKAVAMLTLSVQNGVRVTASGAGGTVSTATPVNVTTLVPVYLYYYRDGPSSYKLDTTLGTVYTAPSNQGAIVVHNLTNAGMTATSGNVKDTAGPGTDALLVVTAGGSVPVTASGSGANVSKTVAVTAGEQKNLYFYRYKDGTTYKLEESVLADDLYQESAKGVIVVHNMTDAGVTATVTGQGVTATASARADALMAVMTTTTGYTVSANGSGVTKTAASGAVTAGAQTDLYFYWKGAASGYVLEKDYTPDQPPAADGQGTVVVHNLTSAGMTASAGGKAASAGAWADAVLTLTASASGTNYSVTATGSGAVKTHDVTLVDGGLIDLYFYQASETEYVLDDAPGTLYTPGQGVIIVHNLTDAAMTATVSNGVTDTARAKTDAVLVVTASSSGTTYTVTVSGSGKTMPPKSVTVKSNDQVALYYYQSGASEYTLADAEGTIWTAAGQGAVVVHNLTDAAMTATSGTVKDTAGPKTDALLVLTEGSNVPVNAAGSGVTLTASVTVDRNQQANLYFYKSTDRSYKFTATPPGADLYQDPETGVIVVHNLTDAGMTATANGVTATASARADALLVVTASATGYTVTASGSGATNKTAASGQVTAGQQTDLYFYNDGTGYVLSASYTPAVVAADGKGVIIVHNLTDTGMTAAAGGVAASAGAWADAVLTLTASASGTQYSVKATGSLGSDTYPDSGTLTLKEGDLTDLYFYRSSATEYKLDTAPGLLYTQAKGVIVVHNLTDSAMTASASGVTATVGGKADAVLQVPAAAAPGIDVEVTASGSGGQANKTVKVTSGVQTDLYYYQGSGGTYVLETTPAPDTAPGYGTVVVHNLTNNGMVASAKVKGGSTVVATAGTSAWAEAVLTLPVNTSPGYTITASGSGASPTCDVQVMDGVQTHLYFYPDSATTYKLAYSADDIYTLASSSGSAVVVVHNLTDDVMTAVGDNGVSDTVAAKADAVLVVPAGSRTVTVSGSGTTKQWSGSLANGALKELYFYQKKTDGTYDLVETAPGAGDLYTQGKAVVVVHNLTDSGMTAWATPDGVYDSTGAREDAVLAVNPGVAVSVYASGSGETAGPVSWTGTQGEYKSLYFYQKDATTYELSETPNVLNGGSVILTNWTETSGTVEVSIGSTSATLTAAKGSDSPEYKLPTGLVTVKVTGVQPVWLSAPWTGTGAAPCAIPADINIWLDANATLHLHLYRDTSGALRLERNTLMAKPSGVLDLADVGKAMLIIGPSSGYTPSSVTNVTVRQGSSSGTVVYQDTSTQTNWSVPIVLLVEGSKSYVVQIQDTGNLKQSEAISVTTGGWKRIAWSSATGSLAITP